MKLTPEQLHILQHSLGCDKHGQTRYRGRDEGDGCGIYHRNHFQTSATSPNGQICESMVALGYMQGGTALNLPYYYVTTTGREAMRRESPPPPKVSRSAARFAEYRRSSECFDGFAGWLGFDMPRFETSYLWPGMVRMTSSRAKGEWCATKKDAKASYKKQLKQNAIDRKTFR